MTTSKHTVGRFLQAKALGGNAVGAAAFADSQGHWSDRPLIVNALKSAVDGLETDDIPAALSPIAAAFVAAMRPYSIPLRLEGVRRVEMYTRIFVGGTRMMAAEITEGGKIPVLRGTWDATTLTPRKFAAITVQTEELVRSTSPTASGAITDDLAQATAEAENLSFLSPDVTGSVLDGATDINATGTNATAIATDLERLFELVAAHGGGGLALVMHEGTATHIHFSDPAQFPNIGPQGGSIAGVPVLISEATDLLQSPIARFIALVNATQILWADRGRVRLTAGDEAALHMDDGPAPGAAQITSLFQTGAVAMRAVRESAWYARAGAGAYLNVGY